MLYKIKKLYCSIRFYFYLYGFIGGVKFASGLVKSGVEKIYHFNLGKNRLNAALINPDLRFQLVESEKQFDDIYKDYVKTKGRLLAEEDRRRIIQKREILGVIYKGDIFAGWGWIKSGPLMYGNNKVSENDYVIHKCRTLRTVRRQRVYATLLVNILKELHNRKTNMVFIGAKDFNIASLTAIEKVGFQLVEKYDSGSFIFRLFSHIKGRSAGVLKD